MEKKYKTLYLYRPFSQCEPGTKIVTQQKIVTTANISQFCEITKQDLPMFLDEKEARANGWPTSLVPGVYTFSCSIGLMEQSGILADVIAFLGTDELRFTNPVFPGDTIYVEAELLSKRLTKAGDRGLVNYTWKTFKTDGTLAASGTNTCMFKVKQKEEEWNFTSVEEIVQTQNQ